MVKLIVLEEKGHGFMNLRNAMKQSCDTYFCKLQRRLGVDKLSQTAKSLVWEKKFLVIYLILKKRIGSKYSMEKNALGQGWLLGETMITGIGQGYIQTTPIQLCLMTAQIGNGDCKIYPQVVVEDEAKKQPTDKFEPLYENSRNIRIIQDAMFSSTNEVMEHLIDQE